VAVYPGAFDPVHLGHVDIARRAAAIFDRVIVAIYDRPSKALAFSCDERIELFRDAMADTPNIEVTGYHGLTVTFARERQARFLVRGLRTATDFDYERQLDTMNRYMEPHVDTVFLITAQQYGHLSSSLIKEIAAQGARIDDLVPAAAAVALRSRLGAGG
jgi:pantetheine-phosphate adenylyltransferase